MSQERPAPGQRAFSGWTVSDMPQEAAHSGLVRLFSGGTEARAHASNGHASCEATWGRRETHGAAALVKRCVSVVIPALQRGEAVLSPPRPPAPSLHPGMGKSFVFPSSDQCVHFCVEPQSHGARLQTGTAHFALSGHRAGRRRWGQAARHTASKQGRPWGGVGPSGVVMVGSRGGPDKSPGLWGWREAI